ncbi:MAG TPA: hypothetical protein VED41_07680 [Solirubrobacteraceae bacterium]|nr:hypothetical protein [Solirubrobacteraceae bacterium]
MRIPGQRRYENAFGRRRPTPTGDPSEKEDAFQKVLADPKARVAFDDVVRLRYWQSHRSRAARRWRDLGDRYFDKVYLRFKAQDPHTDVALYSRSGLGVYRTDTELRYMILNNALRFDWSDAHLLANRIDGIAERAKEWWGPAAAKKSGRQQATAATELRRFIERSMALLSGVFSAVDGENPRDGQRSLVVRSEHYRSKLEMLHARAEKEEVELAEAFQRSAQTCYGRGMAIGAGLVAICCLGVGLALYFGDVPAWYGVAFPAGAAGALVSVLQRMSSNRPRTRLQLDFNAGQRMLTVYGAVRPFVGGLFGFMIFVFLRGSLFPALSITTSAPLATYAGLGFLGGFNERWAQDMLAGSASRLEREAG